MPSAFELLRRSLKYRLLGFFKASNRTVTIHYDTVRYQWADVSEKKYRNWLNVNRLHFDTLEFYADGYPYMLQIEPTSLCNLACPLCPTGRNELGRERRNMTLDEFKSIVDDMEDYLLFLVMWDWGEPLINPDLPAMIRYASERGIKTVTSTNGQFLSDHRYLAELLQSGLTTLIVAIDSIHEDSYQAYRKEGSLNKAVNGLKKLNDLKTELNSPTIINMRMVVMKHNEDEIEQMRELAKKLGVDIFTIKTVNPSCGATSLDEEIVPDNPLLRRYRYVRGTYERVRVDAACDRVWTMSNIFSNGDVVPCCYDYDSELKVGNIREQKFSELWNSEAYRTLRRKIHADKNSLAKCRACGVNFKLSKKGWFVESSDLRRSA